MISAWSTSYNLAPCVYTYTYVRAYNRKYGNYPVQFESTAAATGELLILWLG